MGRSADSRSLTGRPRAILFAVHAGRRPSATERQLGLLTFDESSVDVPGVYRIRAAGPTRRDRPRGCGPAGSAGVGRYLFW